MSQSEIEKMDAKGLVGLMARFDLKKIPVTKSNRKILAKWIFYRIHGIEEMEWEAFSEEFGTQTDLFEESEEASD